MTLASWQSLAGSSGFSSGGRRGKSSPRRIQRVLDDFTRRRDEGEVQTVEDYLAEAGALPGDLVVELAYREYCLQEEEGEDIDEDAFLGRFPAHRAALERLLAVHQACRPVDEEDGTETRPGEDSSADPWGSPGLDDLPVAGDEIGPYLLRREIGRGSFARVFIAEQADLENRLVVVKVSTRRTREPWLLARVRHAHIVEILVHAEVNDGAFQLICMSFQGGATLSAVLDRCREAGAAPRPRGALLRDLDAVAAPEYAAVAPAGPARELIGGLDDAHAMVWIAARLAEALDYAFGRGVSHGDVKPSNILLTADGNPLLLDFNLSQDWSSRRTGPASEVGGTLAYMAPERLRALADRIDGDDIDGEGDGDASTADGPEPWADSVGEAKAASGESMSGVDPRRADIYSLGMVLLEALAGSAAGSPDLPGGRAGISSLARAHASLRERGAAALIRDAEARRGRRIPRGLRHVLEGCLAADPAARYRRAMELAEDLDRWRVDRPPAYAREPFWTGALPRWLRRRRLALAVAALAMAVCVATTGLARLFSDSVLRGRSLHHLARLWDVQEANVFQFRRPYGAPLMPRESQDFLTTAAVALRDYDVLGVDDWRQGEEYRSLPSIDRFDLEAWLMEQAFRYAEVLGRQADAPADWLQAMAVLDRADPTLSLPALEPLRRRLRGQLGSSKTAAHLAEIMSPAKGGRMTPPGADAAEYMLGLVAEFTDGTPEGDATLGDRALRHYRAVLDRRPDSFWGHYRSAVVCFRLRRWAEAAAHLDHCLARRPDNAALRGQFASCLSQLGLHEQAMRECDRALGLAPNHGEFYRSRAFIRASRGQADGVGDDIERFEILTGAAGRSPFPQVAAAFPAEPRDGAPAGRGGPLNLEALGGMPYFNASDSELGEVVRGELDTRAELALRIAKLGSPEISGGRAVQTKLESVATASASAADHAGLLTIADAELGKVLGLDPGHLNARIVRMMELLERGQSRAACEDLERVLEHPDLDTYLLQDEPRFEFLHAAHRFAKRGHVNEAVAMVQRVFRATRFANVSVGRTRYYMARVLSVAGRAEEGRLELAARHLFRAIQNNSRYQEWYLKDHEFDAVRPELDAILKVMREANITE